MTKPRRVTPRHRKTAVGEGGVSPSSSARRHALPRVVFVVGPTSSGKTAVALRLAHALNGEVINADARQVYHGLTIGTGKPIHGTRKRIGKQVVYVVDGVPHYLMDAIPPEHPYSVAEWREGALEAIRSIIRRKKLPIIAGGTGLYTSSLIDNYQFPNVEAQPFLRASLDSKTLDELVQVLLAADPDSATIVDLKNKRRVIRALEVVTFSGKKFSEARGKAEALVEAFQVGVWRDQDDLYERTEGAIDRMFQEGLVNEVRTLLRQGVPPDATSMSSIGYSDVARHLRGELTLEETVALIKRRTRQYTKRQITWFKRDKRIHWVKTENDAVKKVTQWVKKKR